MSAPQVTHERLWRLREIVRRAEESGQPAQETAQQLQEEEPTLRDYFRQMGSPQALPGWLGLLLAILTLLIEHGSPVTDDDVSSMVEFVIEKATQLYR